MGSQPLRDYQAAAVEAIVSGLAEGGRGQCIAACGTGKTIVAAHAVSRLVPADGIAVVSCPSLALVSQTLAMCTAAGIRAKVLAVCGDDTVADAVVHTADLPCPVTMDVGQVADWLTRTGGRRLVATTYRSAQLVGQALTAAGMWADLLVADEAHHTAGRAAKEAAVVHDDLYLPARRRLYLTATPRYLSSGVTPGPDVRNGLVSMDDEAVFGPVLHRYLFGQAITEGWLDDYQVAVIGVTRPEVLAVLRRMDEDAVVSADQPPLRTAVVQTALAQAAREFDLRRVLVFAPRVQLAREFARSLPRTLTAIGLDGQPKRALTAGAVDGTMTLSQRKIHLDHLTDPPDDGWAVVANARCLSEGVDVPAVDGIVFTHPKRSTVDVIQSVGRALRRNPHGTGVSTILVPVLLPDDSQADGIDEDGEYATLWQVIKALRAHDETLAAELDAQRDHNSSGYAEMPPRILVRLPDAYDAEHYLRHLTIRLIENTTSPWLDGLAAARRYHAQHGNLTMLVTYTTSDGYPLGAWIGKQRTYRRRGWLSDDRVAELDKLGMIWAELDRRWQAGVAALRQFVAEHGHGRVPQRYVTADGYRLGSWVSQRRLHHRQGRLAAQRVAEVEAAGMVWEDSDYDRGLAALRGFHAEHGHARVPKGHIRDGINLSEWVNTRRRDRRRGTLEPVRVAELDALGLVWEPFDNLWEQGLAAAAKFFAEHGDLTVPLGTYIDGLDLTRWVMNRRTDYRAGRLTPERVAALEKVGMVWSPHVADWDRGLAAARVFYAREGHLRPPAGHWEEGVQLAAWVLRRRKEYRQGRMPAERKVILDAIGMQWQVRKGARGVNNTESRG